MASLEDEVDIVALISAVVAQRTHNKRRCWVYLYLKENVGVHNAFVVTRQHSISLE